MLAALSVSPATLDSVGSPGPVVPPSSVGGSGAILRAADGKPEITYVGAEYCPYCAAERWALAVALSRFGTFSNLSGTHSSSADVYPNTQTLSFYGSSYSSPTWTSRRSRRRRTSRSVTRTRPSGADDRRERAPLRYDAQGSIPFLDIGNKYVITGASYSPRCCRACRGLRSRRSWVNASSPVAQAIDGTANDITAAICSVTGNQPASVCDAPAIAAIAKSLGRDDGDHIPADRGLLPLLVVQRPQHNGCGGGLRPEFGRTQVPV